MWPISPTVSRSRPTVSCVNALETVTILVVVGAVLLGLIDYLRSGGALDQLGRDGTVWFDHIADLPIEQRPSEDERDAPIPRRPLFRR
jgi:hypothetical protein